jgi:hypothetical protein
MEEESASIDLTHHTDPRAWDYLEMGCAGIRTESATLTLFVRQDLEHEVETLTVRHPLHAGEEMRTWFIPLPQAAKNYPFMQGFKLEWDRPADARRIRLRSLAFCRSPFLTAQPRHWEIPQPDQAPAREVSWRYSFGGLTQENLSELEGLPAEYLTDPHGLLLMTKGTLRDLAVPLERTFPAGPLYVHLKASGDRIKSAFVLLHGVDQETGATVRQRIDLRVPDSPRPVWVKSDLPFRFNAPTAVHHLSLWVLSPEPAGMLFLSELALSPDDESIG